jgi:F0F1-type ATP synthase delta subunit
VPVQVNGIEGHYTTALHSVVSEQNKRAQVEKETLRTAQLLKDLKLFTCVQKAKIKCPIKVKS